MFVLTLLFQFGSKSYRNLVTKVATEPEFLVGKEKMLLLVALVTVSVTILSPVNASDHNISVLFVLPIQEARERYQLPCYPSSTGR